MLSLVLATLVAYLIGSLSFAVIISRVMGLDDPRSYGSQNPGATNVLRSGNRKAALLTLLFDALKGWFPVFLVKVYGERWELPQGTLALVALGAFVGHLWPVFFRFVGGKGVATAAGVLFGLNGWLGLATMATWLIVALFSRYSSLAALAAATRGLNGKELGEYAMMRKTGAKAVATGRGWIADSGVMMKVMTFGRYLT